jgi:hypothetical protein
MSEQKKRPTGIHIENCEDVTLSNNTGIGDMDFIVVKNSKDIKGSGNQHIISSQERASPNKRWFEKPHGTVFLSVVGAVLSGGLLYYFGWH